jgi:hypothetical protein
VMQQIAAISVCREDLRLSDAARHLRAHSRWLREGGAPSERLAKSVSDRVSVGRTVAGSNHLVNRYAWGLHGLGDPVGCPECIGSIHGRRAARRLRSVDAAQRRCNSPRIW